MQRRRQRSLRTFGALLLLLLPCLGLGCGERPPAEPEDLHSALAGKRYVGPALTGLPEAEDCTVSDDFIPKIRCGSAPAEDRLRRLEQKLLAQLGQKPQPAQLRKSAVVRLAADPDSDRVRQAVALLSEALKDEADPQARAALLTDLSAAYLLQAETDQSAMELGFALDSALQALELDPSSEAAEFNKKLALILLGVERADASVDGPLLVEVGNRVQGAAVPSPADDCPTAQDVRIALDDWSSPNPSSALMEIPKCRLRFADHWLLHIAEELRNNPARLRVQWRAYRSAHKSLRSFDKDEFDRRLEDLRLSQLSTPLRVGSQYLVAMQHYMDTDYREAQRILKEHAFEAERLGYLELTALAMRTLALIDGITGNYGRAMEWNQQALHWAEASGSALVVAGVRSQRFEQLVLAGREDEAWWELTDNLRSLSEDSQVRRRSVAFSYAARLAMERSLYQAALRFFEASRTLRFGLKAPGHIELLLEMAQLHLEMGDQNEAEALFESALALVNATGTTTLAYQHLDALLAVFRGLVTDDASRRREILQSAEERLTAAGHFRRAIQVQLLLARAERSLGNEEAAATRLEEAFEVLERQVDQAANWQLAAALVADARPIAEDLLVSLISKGDTKSVISHLGRYFGLRSNRRHHASNPAPGSVRLTTFVREHELVLVLESESDHELVTVPVRRQTLEDLRRTLLGQLASGLPRERVDATLHDLASLVIAPIARTWLEIPNWVIIADDVLAGIPFGLLPLSNDSDAGRVLLDKVAVSYTTDYRMPPDQAALNRILVVGSIGRGSSLPLLKHAEAEAEAVGSLYDDATVSLSPSPHSLLATLSETESKRSVDAIHIAGHFQPNFRSPLDSEMLLDRDDNNSPGGHLLLRDLLEEADGLGLLFLSACDSGAGVPIAAHGLHSLGQAFSSSGIQRTIVSFWRVDDRLAVDLAVRFHQGLLAGMTASQALREAQLEHRDEHPGLWASFALME